MTSSSLTRRSAARRAAVAAATVSAIAVILSAWAVVSPGVADAAAVNAGSAQVVSPSGGPTAGQSLTSGGSATAFSLKLPAGAACTSDGLNGGRANTYMIPSAQNPASDLTFNGNGSIIENSTGTGGAGTFKNNLYTVSGNPGRTITLNTTDAVVINIPNFDLKVWSPGQVPPGVYNIGIACLDLDEANAINNYWNTQLTVVAAANDPDGISWTAAADAPSGSSTTSSTASTTSTTAGSGGSSTSTSTTTSSSSSSTSSTVIGGSTTTVAGSSTGGTTTGGSGSQGGLPSTGANVLRLTVWALLFVIFGRIALVLGRSTPAGDRGSMTSR